MIKINYLFKNIAIFLFMVLSTLATNSYAVSFAQKYTLSSSTGQKIGTLERNKGKNHVSLTLKLHVHTSLPSQDSYTMRSEETETSSNLASPHLSFLHSLHPIASHSQFVLQENNLGVESKRYTDVENDSTVQRTYQWDGNGKHDKHLFLFGYLFEQELAHLERCNSTDLHYYRLYNSIESNDDNCISSFTSDGLKLLPQTQETAPLQTVQYIPPLQIFVQRPDEMSSISVSYVYYINTDDNNYNTISRIECYQGQPFTSDLMLTFTAEHTLQHPLIRFSNEERSTRLTEFEQSHFHYANARKAESESRGENKDMQEKPNTTLMAGMIKPVVSEALSTYDLPKQPKDLQRFSKNDYKELRANVELLLQPLPQVKEPLLSLLDPLYAAIENALSQEITAKHLRSIKSAYNAFMEEYSKLPDIIEEQINLDGHIDPQQFTQLFRLIHQLDEQFTHLSNLYIVHLATADHQSPHDIILLLATLKEQSQKKAFPALKKNSGRTQQSLALAQTAIANLQKIMENNKDTPDTQTEKKLTVSVQVMQQISTLLTPQYILSTEGQQWLSTLNIGAVTTALAPLINIERATTPYLQMNKSLIEDLLIATNKPFSTEHPYYKIPKQQQQQLHAALLGTQSATLLNDMAIKQMQEKFNAALARSTSSEESDFSSLFIKSITHDEVTSEYSGESSLSEHNAVSCLLKTPIKNLQSPSVTAALASIGNGQSIVSIEYTAPTKLSCDKSAQRLKTQERDATLSVMVNNQPMPTNTPLLLLALEEYPPEHLADMDPVMLAIIMHYKTKLLKQEAGNGIRINTKGQVEFTNTYEGYFFQTAGSGQRSLYQQFSTAEKEQLPEGVVPLPLIHTARPAIKHTH